MTDVDRRVLRLRARARAAIAKDGLIATAKRIGVVPATLKCFAAGAGRAHKGTMAIIEKALA